jgi:hypothetical protein
VVRTFVLNCRKLPRSSFGRAIGNMPEQIVHIIHVLLMVLSQVTSSLMVMKFVVLCRSRVHALGRVSFICCGRRKILVATMLTRLCRWMPLQLLRHLI